MLTAAPAAQPDRGRNLILITLDGARTQEIFGGLDVEVLRSGLKKDERLEDARAYKQVLGRDAEARRAKVMPFFWTEWMRSHGSIAGNRAAGSRFGITNTHRFSYPGYAEILTGEAHDGVIESNDDRRYPFPTLLDVVQRRLSLSREQVAAFGSWSTFRWIVSSQEDAFVVNAGYQAFASDRPDVQRLSRAQFETQTPWDSVRNDMYTFRLALAHLQAARPRALVRGAGRDRRLGTRRALRPRPSDARTYRRLVQGTVDLAASRPAVSRQHRHPHHRRSRAGPDAAGLGETRRQG